LLKAEENADSTALDNAMSKLFDMKPPPSDTSPEMVRKAEVCHQRGMAAFNQKKYRDALASLKEAQSENVWDATILNDLIRVLIKTNDLDSAVLYAPVAILVAPASTTAWDNMAEVFARAKQYSRARGCVYLACLMSDDSSKTLPAIQSEIASIEESEVRAPFRQGLFIAQYTMKAYVDTKSGNIGQDKEIGPEADAALYKANMLLSCADALQKIKPNSGIVIVVTISKTGQVLSSEVLRSSGDQDLDKMAVKALSEAKLLPLPKSIQSDSQQYIVLVDKVVQALAEPKHG
jgi:TonB family protein